MILFYLIEKMRNKKQGHSFWMKIQNLDYKTCCLTGFIRSMEGVIPFVYQSLWSILDWIHWPLAWIRTLAWPIDSSFMLMTNSLRPQTDKWGYIWNPTKVPAPRFHTLKLKPFKSSTSLEENHHAGDEISKELLISSEWNFNFSVMKVTITAWRQLSLISCKQDQVAEFPGLEITYPFVKQLQL